MPRRFYKHKLLLDEGFLLRKRLPILNSRFDVKHITADLGYKGLKEPLKYSHNPKQDNRSISRQPAPTLTRAV